MKPLIDAPDPEDSMGPADFAYLLLCVLFGVCIGPEA
jgi:hypothetical protein